MFYLRRIKIYKEIFIRENMGRSNLLKWRKIRKMTMENLGKVKLKRKLTTPITSFATVNC
jgi:ABC-type sugar transport system ATPase subunit